MLITIASARLASGVMAMPSSASRPSIRSLSTRFLAQPRLTNATDRMGLSVGMGNGSVSHGPAGANKRYVRGWGRVCSGRTAGAPSAGCGPSAGDARPPAVAAALLREGR